MSGPLDERRLTADLRRAAESFEPDADRIRQRMAERSAPNSLVRGGRPMMTTWVAAAASVVLAVSGAEVLISGWGDDSQLSDVVGQTGAAAGSSTVAASDTPPGVTPTGATSQGTTSPGATSPGATPTGATSPGATPTAPAAAVDVTGVPASTTRAATRATARATSRPASPGAPYGSERVLGDRDVSVEVEAVSAGTYRVLGMAGEQWLVPPAAIGKKPPHNTEQGGPVGPPQVMGNGASIRPGPFAVMWADAVADEGVSAGVGSSTTWLTAPQNYRGVSSAVRVPIRYSADAVTITVLTGTVGGSGKLTARLGKDTLEVDLPGCAGDDACAAVVRVVLRLKTGVAPSSGDFMIDLTATDPAGSVGFAGATLS